MNKENGFSLLEVSVAVAIMGALTGFGIVLAGGLATGNSSTAQGYETSAQANIDNAACEAAKVDDESLSCSGGGSGGGGGASSGIIAIWDGVNITYSIDSGVCTQSSPMVAYYYLNSGDGTVLMATSDDGSFAPAAAGYSLGQNLGYGVTIQSYFVIVECGGTPTQSDNYVS